LLGRIGHRFARVEPRRRVGSFLLGLLAGLPRVNCWTIAEHAGDSSPDGMQHLLARAARDADAVRDDLRGYVVDHLADPGAVLVVDETGDLKKGVHTVGVQRQYTGTAGRIENAQVGGPPSRRSCSGSWPSAPGTTSRRVRSSAQGCVEVARARRAQASGRTSVRRIYPVGH